MSLLPPNWLCSGILQHRVPVDGGIILRRCRLVRRAHGGEIEHLARLAVHLRRVDQTVAAHPHLILGLRQIGDEVTPLIVGDHDPGELGGQVRRLRDHPHAGFWPLGAGDHAAEVTVADADCFGGVLLGTQPGW